MLYYYLCYSYIYLYYHTLLIKDQSYTYDVYQLNCIPIQSFENSCFSVVIEQHACLVNVSFWHDFWHVL
jgi:hypothetical protein